MQEMNIVSNKHWRPFFYRCDVPKEALEDFDYQDENENTDGFIQYQGHWYHLDSFMSLHNQFHFANPPEAFKGWDGVCSQGYVGGLLLKCSDDMESYQIGRY